jgi:hypothetical protein
MIETLMNRIMVLAHEKFKVDEDVIDPDVISIGTYHDPDEWSVWLARPTSKTVARMMDFEEGIGHRDVVEVEIWFDNDAPTLEEALNMLHDELNEAEFSRAGNNRMAPKEAE